MTTNTFELVGAELAAVLPQDDKPWYKKRNQVYLNFCIMSLFLLSSGNGYDGSMLNGLLALTPWQSFMNDPTGAWLGFISGSQNLGSIAFYPVVAWASNRFGRKPTIFTGYFFLCLGAGLQTGAVNVPMFVVSRLMIGVASAFFGGCVPLLMTETAYPTHRGIITSLYMCGWYVGSFLAAWATFGTRNYDNSWAWRIPSLLQVLLPVLALPGLCMMPESPRFFASKKRDHDARAFLVKYHAEGDESSPLAAFELAEITRSIQMESEIQMQTSYRDMVATAANRKRTFITVFLGVFVQWAGQNVAGFYLPPVLATIGITTFTPLMTAYPVEIWQYSLRSRGLSVMWISTVTAVFFNLFINPIALEAIGWKYYLPYVFILAGGGVVIYYTFPETRGHTLEEIARVFNGEDVDVSREDKLEDHIKTTETTHQVNHISKV